MKCPECDKDMGLYEYALTGENVNEAMTLYKCDCDIKSEPACECGSNMKKVQSILDLVTGNDSSTYYWYCPNCIKEAVNG